LFLVQKVTKETKVLLVNKVVVAQLVLRGNQETLVHKAFRVNEEKKAAKANEASKVKLVRHHLFLDQKATKVQLETQVQKEIKDHLVL
jgi:hypothetical protein